MGKIIIEHGRSGCCAKRNTLLAVSRHTRADSASGSHQDVHIRNQLRKQHIQSLQACCRSHEIAVIKGKHHRISAHGIEDIGKVFLHSPVQIVGSLYMKITLIRKRNVNLIILRYF